MIYLYDPTNTDFEHNGNVTLHPESCVLSMETNGTWEVELEQPIDNNGEFQHVVENAVLSVPTPMSEENKLFRIYKKNKTDDGVTAYVRPLFFDAAHDAYIIDKRPTSTTGQQALNVLTEGTKYQVSSDITDIKTTYIQNKNLIEALFSDDDNSFLKRWGGEPIFDNYKAIINKRCGGDYGFRVTFGRNLMGIEEEVSMDDVVTRIYPQAYNGYTLQNNGYVDSPNIGKYPIPYCKHIEFSDLKLQSDCQDGETGYATLADLQAALIERCNKEYGNGIDKPTITYKIDMVDLSATDEYKDYKGFETVGLGDTVYCQNDRIGVETTARVVKLTYDCIMERTETLELGDAETTYFDKLNSSMQQANKAFDSTGNVKGEGISGVIDMMQTVLKASRGIAKKQQERAILFEDLDPDSPTFGATCYGTKGWQISDERTADGKDWVWKTCATGSGILAEYLIGKYLISQNYDEGKRQGVKFDLINGYLKAFKMIIDTDYFKVDEDGRVSILDGYININTNSQKESHISLNSDAGEYGTYGMNLCPLSLDIKSTNQNTSSSVTAAGISAFRGSEFVLAQPNLIQLHDENGGAELTTEKLRKLLELIN